jgi:hypothetical protein
MKKSVALCVLLAAACGETAVPCTPPVFAGGDRVEALVDEPVNVEVWTASAASVTGAPEGISTAGGVVKGASISAGTFSIQFSVPAVDDICTAEHTLTFVVTENPQNCASDDDCRQLATLDTSRTCASTAQCFGGGGTGQCISAPLDSGAAYCDTTADATCNNGFDAIDVQNLGGFATTICVTEASLGLACNARGNCLR